MAADLLPLPPPEWERLGPLGVAITRRRSLRRFSPSPIPAHDLSLLLASAYGVTSPRGGLRAVPSGGSTYPLELYVVGGETTLGGAGVFRYLPREHALERARKGDLRAALARAAHRQPFVAQAPLSVLLAADYPRITESYGRRGLRYALLEAGHVAQNLLLAATGLGMGGVPVGAFDEDAVHALLGIPQEPVYLVPVGFPLPGGEKAD